MLKLLLTILPNEIWSICTVGRLVVRWKRTCNRKSTQLFHPPLFTRPSRHTLRPSSNISCPLFSALYSSAVPSNRATQYIIETIPKLYKYNFETFNRSAHFYGSVATAEWNSTRACVRGKERDEHTARNKHVLLTDAAGPRAVYTVQQVNWDMCVECPGDNFAADSSCTVGGRRI